MLSPTHKLQRKGGFRATRKPPCLRAWRTCCPVPVFDGVEDAGQCGSDLGRGSCQAIKIPESDFSRAQPDVRVKWPIQYFSYTCVCGERYGGYDCGECSYAYNDGTTECSTKTIRPKRYYVTRVVSVSYSYMPRPTYDSCGICLTRMRRSNKYAFFGRKYARALHCAKHVARDFINQRASTLLSTAREGMSSEYGTTTITPRRSVAAGDRRGCYYPTTVRKQRAHLLPSSRV